MFNESKGCHMCRMMRVVTIYLRKHSITPVLADTPQQSKQCCTPLVNKQHQQRTQTSHTGLYVIYLFLYQLPG